MASFTFKWPHFHISPATETFLRSASVFAALMTGIGLMGSLAGGTAGIYVSLGFSLSITLLTIYYARELVLWLMSAKEVKPSEKPEGFDLHAMIETLKSDPAFNIQKTPKICIIESDKINAFATGRHKEHAAVAITTGLLKKAIKKANGDMAKASGWITAIWCHELGHLANYDIALNSTAAILGSVSQLLAEKAFNARRAARKQKDEENLAKKKDKGDAAEAPKEDNWTRLIAEYMVLRVAIPFATNLLTLCLSRTREFAADDMASRCGYGEELASAFEQLLMDEKPSVGKKDPQLAAFSHMLCLSLDHAHDDKVAQNAKEKNMGWYMWARQKSDEFNSTHPPIRDRIARLREAQAHQPSSRSCKA